MLGIMDMATVSATSRHIYVKFYVLVTLICLTSGVPVNVTSDELTLTTLQQSDQTDSHFDVITSPPLPRDNTTGLTLNSSTSGMEKGEDDLATTAPSGVSNYSPEIATSDSARGEGVTIDAERVGIGLEDTTVRVDKESLELLLSGLGFENDSDIASDGINKTRQIDTDVTGVQNTSADKTTIAPEVTSNTSMYEPDMVMESNSSIQTTSPTLADQSFQANHVTNQSQSNFNGTSFFTPTTSRLSVTETQSSPSDSTWSLTNVSEDAIRTLTTTLGSNVTGSSLNESASTVWPSVHPLTVGSDDKPSLSWTLSVTYILSVALVVGVTALLVVMVVAGKRCIDGHRKRTYSRLAGDLVNGIYST